MTIEEKLEIALNTLKEIAKDPYDPANRYEGCDYFDETSYIEGVTQTAKETLQRIEV
jgi:hypothetical protein